MKLSLVYVCTVELTAADIRAVCKNGVIKNLKFAWAHLTQATNIESILIIFQGFAGGDQGELEIFTSFDLDYFIGDKLSSKFHTYRIAWKIYFVICEGLIRDSC